MRLPIALRWARAHFDGMRLYSDGDHAGAEPALRRAIALASRLRPRDGRLAYSVYAIGRLRQVHGELVEAQRLYAKGVSAEEAALGADHPYAQRIAAACATVSRQSAGRAAVKRLRRRPVAKHAVVTCGVPARL